ncbi:MAG TPA: methylase [Alphaproteobacteria bacterium]|nr:methylase [Alphaproteobacteria bacterium]
MGEPTRGKTAPNRLRRVDAFVLGYDRELLRRAGPFRRAFFVDLGYGWEPVTTLQSAERLREVNRQLPVLGVEIDQERVAAAQAYQDAKTFFRLGGFNLPLGTWPDGIPETVRLVRAFNVLRQYEEVMVGHAYELMMRDILPGGLLIEGTSNPYGSVWVANVARRLEGAAAPWQLEALVFSTNFRDGFDPGQFQPVLPKNLIHHVVPGEPIHAFFRDWKRAALETIAEQAWGPRRWFVAAAERLAKNGYKIDQRRRWLRKGWLIWQKPSV